MIIMIMMMIVVCDILTKNYLCVCVFSFQRKVEMFHETQAEFGDRADGYVSRTIALANCIPPFRSVQELS